MKTRWVGCLRNIKVTHFKLSLNNDKKVDVLVSLGLCLLAIISRIPFTSKFLYEWDSVDYALAFEKYDISHHQPHPPGYILFVALGRIVNIIFNDANATIIFLSVIFSILTTLLLYFLAKQMFSRVVGISSSLLLLFNPMFWFFGEVATIYAAEAFLATLIAYLSYQVFRGKESFLYWSTLALGLAGGIRQDITLFMFPLWLFCLFYHDRSFKRITQAFVLLTVSVLVWYVPMILFTGGYEMYSSLSSAQLIRAFQHTSIFFGADIFHSALSVIKLFSWSIIGLSFLGFLIISIYCKTKIQSVELLSIKKNPKLIFFLLWIMPSFLFYLLIYIIKPGYILVYLPALQIIVGYAFTLFSFDLKTKFKVISPHTFLLALLLLSVVFNAVYFLNPYELDNEKIGYEISFRERTLSQKLLTEVNLLFLTSTANEIKNEDKKTELYISQIINISHSDPNTVLIICRDGELDWRKAMYYLPNHNVYWLLDSEITGRKNYGLEVLYAKNHSHTSSSIEQGFYLPAKRPDIVEIPINKSTKKIVWLVNDKSDFFNELKSKIEIATITLPNGSKFYYSDIRNQNINFNVNGFIFRR